MDTHNDCLRVLAACEESQRVCIEFRRLGHEAYSCDIEPCSGGHPEYHIQADVLPLLNGNCSFRTMDGITHRIDGKWDMIIAFPPCTYLTVAGNRWFDIEKYGDKAVERKKNREHGKQFFMQFVNADCDKIAIENPIGIMNTAYRKPDCIIQPWQFGHNASKSTCLWLKNLDVLKPTNIIRDEQKRKENQQISSDGKLLGFMTRDSSGKIMRYNDPETQCMLDGSRMKQFPEDAMIKYRPDKIEELIQPVNPTNKAVILYKGVARLFENKETGTRIWIDTKYIKMFKGCAYNYVETGGETDIVFTNYGKIAGLVLPVRMPEEQEECRK